MRKMALLFVLLSLLITRPIVGQQQAGRLILRLSTRTRAKYRYTSFPPIYTCSNSWG